jgi:glycosyltransferase involved in cell wall biosynthesis
MASTVNPLNALRDARIALVHYWYVHHRGGERVLDAMAETFPTADLFIMVADPAAMPEVTRRHKLTTSFLQRIPGAKRHYRKLMPLMPLALESFDLDDYDIVISHEAGPAKGVLTRSRTLHINYSHSPMRHIWEMYREYRRSAPGGALGRFMYGLASHYMRLWDFAAASRVDEYIASSRNGALRIEKYYRRKAKVLYPPVDISHCVVRDQREDFYLVVSALTAYKRIDLAIQACSKLGRKLKIVGRGEAEAALRKMAGSSIEFLGYQSDDIVHDLYSRCRAFLFPGEEDIGLTPVEAQASGAPVIAFGAGGALETVRAKFTGEGIAPNATGVFFPYPSADCLADAVEYFEQNEHRFSREQLVDHAAQFSTPRFQREFVDAIALKYADFQRRFVVDRQEPMPSEATVRASSIHG